MTTIPPNWMGSVIQTQGAQDRAGQAKNAEDAEETKRTGGKAFSEKLQDVIENSDRDVEVYSDAEGTGSQGSPFEAPDEERDRLDEEDEDEDEEQDGAAHLDIEA